MPNDGRSAACALGAGGVPAAALDVTDSMVLVNVLLKDRGGKNNTG